MQSPKKCKSNSMIHKKHSILWSSEVYPRKIDLTLEKTINKNLLIIQNLKEK